VNDKHIAALEMRKLGNTFKEIGEHLGVSPSRASQIYYRAASLERMGRQPHKWTHGLTTKTANALISAGFIDKDEVIASLESGKLGINSVTGKGKFYGINHHTISEILLWTGADSASIPSIQAAITLLEAHGYNVTRPSISSRDGLAAPLM
jgi:hypothetical protein